MEEVSFDTMAERLRNWGRWGARDMRGTLNHIGPETLKRAAAEVQAGKSFSLGLEYNRDGPQDGRHRTNPKLTMLQVATALGTGGRATMSDDKIEMSLQCATQWDALAHVHYDGEIYNGCKLCDTVNEEGAAQHGIEHLANPGIVSRGVLIDVARHHGVDRLPGDYQIRVDDIRATLDAQNVLVLPGDIVLVRTGQMRQFTVAKDRDAYLRDGAGLHGSCAEWLYETSAAAVAADNIAVEYVDMAAFLEGLRCRRSIRLPARRAAAGFHRRGGSPVNPVVLK